MHRPVVTLNPLKFIHSKGHKDRKDGTSELDRIATEIDLPTGTDNRNLHAAETC
ncbi:MAG: hypothetical protein JOZ08_23975 [Verrucomicrobia bacterium]|nr:hypothetical protein [Verrucomicrobiota bacterium]